MFQIAIQTLLKNQRQFLKKNKSLKASQTRIATGTHIERISNSAC